MKYIIHDWAGNLLFDGQSFESFEDVWEFIYSKFPNATEEEFGEYYVELKPNFKQRNLK